MSDLISREALKEDFKRRLALCNEWLEKAKDKETKIRASAVKTFIVDVLITIDNAPTALLPDFKEGYKQAIIDGKTIFSRPQGEWIDEGQYAEYHSEHAYLCKNCGYQIIESPNKIFENRFCKHCGAYMIGGAEND